LAEVDVSANLPALEGRRIHGAIDRLIIGDDHVLAVDFKTNRQVPETADACPLGVLQQMGAYHAALGQIFPDHQVRVAILWTANSNLMTLPEPLVSKALNRVTLS
jgi:ATP-dependent helicase/nuclease subunit A